jgi:hypothetical protein
MKNFYAKVTKAAETRNGKFEEEKEDENEEEG